MSLSAGTRLGRHEILGPLGAGGMGEVYRARDLGLGREVAIKVLPEEVAQDPHRLQRFRHEARAASSLNHPNILDVHDIGTHEGAPYLVCELLEGETLRGRLREGPLPVGEAVGYGVQIARGLGAAQAKGIIHRDLKPDNLFLTEDGRVKILDFGLAKLVRTEPAIQSSDDTVTRDGATETGAVVGTVGYVSPEQIRGYEVDHRSDIFAFGAVLYEMLSGRRAFHAETPAETMTAILKEDPPELTREGGEIPPGLARIVHRCLDKSPGRRFHSAEDLALALEAVSDAPVGTTRAAERGRRRWPLPRSLAARVSSWRWAVAVIAAAVVLSAGWSWFRARGTKPPDESPIVVPVTSLPGMELDPALSPDAERVAFVWDGPDRDNFDVYVKAIGGEEIVRVTRDPAPDHHPVWSPDGRRIAFLRERGQGADVLLVPVGGGPEQKLAELTDLPRLYVEDVWSFWLDWSPDGRFLAATDRGAGGESWGIVLISVETGEKRALTATGTPRVIDRLPAFSPDGGALAFLRGHFAPEADLLVQPLTGDATPAAPARVLLQGANLHAANSLFWMSGGRELVVGDQRVSEDGSRARPLHAGGREVSDSLVGGLSGQVSLRRTRLVFSTPEGRLRLFRVDLAVPQGEPRAFLPSTRGERHAAFSPDGRKVAFVSGRSGDFLVWVCNVDGSDCHALPQGGSSPAWSPDGRRLAFDAPLADMQWHVFVTAPEGGLPQPLTSSRTYDARPRYSRDGRWIYFTSRRSGEFQIWRTRADASEADAEATQITRQGAMEAEESADSRYLYYAKRNRPGLWRLSLDGPGATREEKVLDIGGEGRWSLRQDGILLLVGGRGVPPAVAFFDFATRRVSEVRALPRDWDFVEFGGAFAVFPDGQWAVVTVEQIVESDIMMVDEFR
jgi:Tol biopolymer transport system component